MVTAEQGHRERRTARDPSRAARFQPLLLLVAVVAVVPTAVTAGADARPWLLGLLGLLATASVVAWWWGTREEVGQPAREVVAFTLVLAATGSFLGLLAVLGRDRPEAFLPLAAALICTVTAVPHAPTRWMVQFLAGAGAAGAIVLAGRPVADVLLVVVLLGSLTVLGTALAHDLAAARRSERRERRGAERRRDLLAAVRALPGDDLERASRAACASLRTLGFDAAAVLERRGDLLVPLHRDGLDDRYGPARVDEGVVGTCLTEDRTVVVEDYHADARRLADRPEVGATVVAPIRAEGAVAGVLVAIRRRPGPVTPAQAEVAEVVAAHLGGVFRTDGTVRHQRALLDRMGTLERMRTGFVSEVSDELRDPLTVVRGIGQTLATYGRELDDHRREQLLERMEAQTAQLRRTIDAVLDFSRFQAGRPEPALRPVDLADLLDAVTVTTGVRFRGDTTTAVLVDEELVRHALELLVAGAPAGLVAAVAAEDGAVGIELPAAPEPAAPEPDAPEPDATPRAAAAAGGGPLLRSLAAQLLVSGGGRLRVEGRHTVVDLPAVPDQVAAR